MYTSSPRFPLTPNRRHILLLLLVLLSQLGLRASASASSDSCRLSDRSQAAVTLYTNAAMTIISTSSIRFVDAFSLAWIAWLPLVRGIVGVFIYTVEFAKYAYSTLTNLNGFSTDSALASNPSFGSDTRTHRTTSPSRHWHIQREVPILNHVTWWVWHVYLPLSQWLWFANHYQIATPLLLVARGTSIGTQLVAMSIDYKTSVIRAVASSSFPAKNTLALLMFFISLIMRLALSGLMTMEFTFALLRSSARNRRDVIPPYAMFSIIWAAASFFFAPGRDKNPETEQSPADDRNWGSMFPVLAARPFTSAIVALLTSVIPFAVFQSVDGTNGLSIPEYVRCGSTSVWVKIQNIAF